jgi:predicted CopG family antitoxin
MIKMRLKNIAISQRNYETLQNLGKMGMSFNDVISDLIMTKLHSMEYSHLSDNFKKIWSEERPRNHTQTVTSSPSNSGI